MASSTYLGWSFGNVLAFEVARQLSDAGRQMKGVILIDSSCLVNHKPLPDSVITHFIKSSLINDAGYAATQNLSAQFRSNAALLENYEAPQTDFQKSRS